MSERKARHVACRVGGRPMRHNFREGVDPGRLGSSTIVGETIQRRRRRGSPMEEFQMRFMSIVTSAHSGPPTPELIEAMNKLADREIKAGRMIDMGGLMPLATGARVSIADGQLSVLDGPFVEAKEVIGGYAIFEFQNKEEAVACAVEFMQLHKDFMPGWDGTCEVRAFATP
jgi:hypothetical protein